MATNLLGTISQHVIFEGVQRVIRITRGDGSRHVYDIDSYKIYGLESIGHQHRVPNDCYNRTKARLVDIWPAGLSSNVAAISNVLLNQSICMAISQ
jgi:hypothetical protein